MQQHQPYDDELPAHEKDLDPLCAAHIVRADTAGDYSVGHVEDILRESDTQERLYIIKYGDGDTECLSAKEVREMQLADPLDPLQLRNAMMRTLGVPAGGKGGDGSKGNAHLPPRVVPRESTSARLKLQAMFHDRDFTDCKMVCGGREFPCHRIVLATASPVWRVALAGPFQESRDAVIAVTDADPSTVEALLKYVYGGKVEATHAQAMMPLAHRYEMDELIGLCARALCDTSITDKNVVDIVSQMNTFLDHSKVSQHWPRLVKRVCASPDLRDAVFRSVRARRI